MLEVFIQFIVTHSSTSSSNCMQLEILLIIKILIFPSDVQILRKILDIT